MKLYLISLNQNLRSYDCTHEMLIRAASPKAARRIAYEASTGDQGKNVWLDCAKSTCERLREDGAVGVIITDSLAG